MTTDILGRLIAIHQVLDAAGFDHAVGGALSLAMHVSNPRGTADIDLNITAGPTDAEAVLACLPAEIEIPADAVKQIRDNDQVRLIWPHPITPVDLFFTAHPTYHRLVNARAREFSFRGVPIKVLEPVDLTVFKVLFNRSKDWVDIETMLRESLGDPTESRRWLVEILGEDNAALHRFDDAVASQWGQPEDPEPIPFH